MYQVKRVLQIKGDLSIMVDLDKIKKHTLVFCNDCDKETKGKLIPEGDWFYIECSKCGGYDFDYIKHGQDSFKLQKKLEKTA